MGDDDGREHASVGALDRGDRERRDLAAPGRSLRIAEFDEFRSLLHQPIHGLPRLFGGVDLLKRCFQRGAANARGNGSTHYADRCQDAGCLGRHLGGLELGWPGC